MLAVSLGATLHHVRFQLSPAAARDFELGLRAVATGTSRECGMDVPQSGYGGASMTNIVVVHGAWSAGWAWKKMHPLMRAAGHEFFTPTSTGLGERVHLSNPSIDLDTHIEDVLNVLQFEDLRDVVLLGHSYGGMVATGVADRARPRRAARLSRCVRAA
jgi:pimeloyl-ACP methyl ester carboxylesterase